MRRAPILLLLALSLGHPLRAQFSTGLEFTSPALYLSYPLASTPLMGLLPRSADLSPLLPQPGDQGQQASCVGWAVAYAMKTYQEGVERRWPLDQPSAQFSPAFIYNQIRRSQDCGGGTFLPDALNLVQRAGAAPLSDFPYTPQACTAVPSAAVRRSARHFAIADWRRVDTRDQLEVKSYVAAGIPVMIGMRVDEPFMRLRGPVTYTQYSGVALGGHALLVVGYDDSRAAFRVINSWGTGWGDGGFGWISYGAFRQTVVEGYVARDISPIAFVQLPTLPQRRTEPVLLPAEPATAQVAIVEIAHDVMLRRPADVLEEPGMRILVRGSVLNGIGRSAQVVVRFTLPDGTTVAGDPERPAFRDVRGFAATTTAPLRVTESPFTVSRTVAIPYSFLLAPAARPATSSGISAVATIYLDNFEVAKSEPKSFTFPR